jgi:hypothetical protein
LNKKKDIRDFFFRGLMFESEATKFQTAGIQIGASSTHAEEQLLSESLTPFSIPRRNSALEMARLYAVLHCFENEIREYIRETLADKEGIDWWTKLPPKMKTHAEGRQETALKDSWLEGEKSDLLGFVDFGMLSAIIIEKWPHFTNLIPSQHWLKQRMEELEKVRNFIAQQNSIAFRISASLYVHSGLE